MLTIEIGCDHAGFDLKQIIVKYLENKGFKVNDHGTNSNQSVDYPDFAHSVAKSLKDIDSINEKRGVLICGSGNGINITANKYAHIRAALCWNAQIAEMARLHNNANVLTLPGRYISPEEAIQALDVFLRTEFEGGRHQARIEKISGGC